MAGTLVPPKCCRPVLAPEALLTVIRRCGAIHNYRQGSSRLEYGEEMETGGAFAHLGEPLSGNDDGYPRSSPEDRTRRSLDDWDSCGAFDKVPRAMGHGAPGQDELGYSTGTVGSSLDRGASFFSWPTPGHCGKINTPYLGTTACCRSERFHRDRASSPYGGVYRSNKHVLQVSNGVTLLWI